MIKKLRPYERSSGVCQNFVGIFNIAHERGGVSLPVLCVLVQTHRGANQSVDRAGVLCLKHGN